MQYRLLQVICLSNIGGRHIDEFTCRVMAFLMANDLAMKYNKFGRNEKEAFKKCGLFEVFYRKLHSTRFMQLYAIKDVRR